MTTLLWRILLSNARARHGSLVKDRNVCSLQSNFVFAGMKFREVNPLGNTNSCRLVVIKLFAFVSFTDKTKKVAVVFHFSFYLLQVGVTYRNSMRVLEVMFEIIGKFKIRKDKIIALRDCCVYANANSESMRIHLFPLIKYCCNTFRCSLHRRSDWTSLRRVEACTRRSGDSQRSEEVSRWTGIVLRCRPPRNWMNKARSKEIFHKSRL